MLVGITGPSGSGKGCVSKVFAGRGFKVIDADAIARDVVQPGEPALSALSEAFGGDIIMPGGALDRRLLASRAFSSRQATERLNQIMHTGIIRRMTAQAEEYAAQGMNCLFDAPLLIEAELDRICDVCVAVIAPEEVRIGRLRLRDGIPDDEIKKRISRQHDDKFYVSRCEYVIINDGDIAKLEHDSSAVADEILKLCKR